MYEQQAPKEWEFIVSDAGVNPLVLCSTLALYPHVREMADRVGIEHVLCFEVL